MGLEELTNARHRRLLRRGPGLALLKPFHGAGLWATCAQFHEDLIELGILAAINLMQLDAVDCRPCVSTWGCARRASLRSRPSASRRPQGVWRGHYRPGSTAANVLEVRELQMGHLVDDDDEAVLRQAGGHGSHFLVQAEGGVVGVDGHLCRKLGSHPTGGWQGR